MPGSTTIFAFGMPAASQASDACLQEIEHVERDVGVLRVVVHRLRVAVGMHQHDGKARLRRGAQRVGIMGQRGDVIHDICAGGGGVTHHLGLARVDRDQLVGPASQPLDDGQ